MGYYTTYELDVKGIRNDAEYTQLIDALRPLDIFDLDDDPETGSCSFYCDDIHKWYEHDEDMQAISLKFPHMMFCLYGKGEDDDDIWRSCYYRGLSEDSVGSIVYEPFEELDWDKFPAYGLEPLSQEQRAEEWAQVLDSGEQNEADPAEKFPKDGDPM